MTTLKIIIGNIFLLGMLCATSTWAVGSVPCLPKGEHCGSGPQANARCCTGKCYQVFHESPDEILPVNWCVDADPVHPVDPEPTPDPNPNFKCVADAQCGTYQICVNAICQSRFSFPTCRQDSECATTQFCADNVCLNRGRQRHDCRNDGECGSSENCLGGACRSRADQRRCATPKDCHGNEQCSAGVCIPD